MNLPLSFLPVSDDVFSVVDAQDRHVGNLKRINGQWKFKAVGYTGQGAVIPGGGPLTGQHNRVFERPDPAVVIPQLLAC